MCAAFAVRCRRVNRVIVEAAAFQGIEQSTVIFSHLEEWEEISDKENDMI